MNNIAQANALRASHRRTQKVVEAALESGFTSIIDVLICQYDSVAQEGRSSFRNHLMTHPGFRSMVTEIAVDMTTLEMQKLERNSKLRLPQKEINPDTLEKFSLAEINRIYQDDAPFLWSLIQTSIKINTLDVTYSDNAASARNHDQQPRHNPQIEDSDADSEDNELQYSLETESEAENYEAASDPEAVLGPKKNRRRNKALIATVCICLLSYARNKNTNLLQMVNGYFSFAQNVPKRCIEVFHQMGLTVTGETVRRSLQFNAAAILDVLKTRAAKEPFFISYDNMNFYEKVKDQRMYNQAHQVNYTAGYICFMKGAGYLNSDAVDYNAVNSLTPFDFLRNPSDLKHHEASARYVLSDVLGHYFPKQITHQKVNVGGVWLPKYRKWPMPLENIQCAVQKADIIPLPTLPYNEASISATIDIIREIMTRMGLDSHLLQGHKIMFKGDLLTVRNITRAIYRKQEEPSYMHSLAWIEPVAGLFHLQLTLVKLILTTFWGDSGDEYSFHRFSTALPGRSSVTSEAKDFHKSDDFLRTVVQASIIALCMHESACSTIGAFQTWLSQHDWPKLLKKVVEAHLKLSTVHELQCAAEKGVAHEVNAALATEQEEFQKIRKKGQRQPNWVNRRLELTKKMSKPARDVVRENALLATSCGLLYLDFIDACRGGYSGRMEKCLETFTVMLQGTKFTNYAGECIHLVACIRRLWKPEFRQAWLDYSLINISGQAGKFYPDDRFGETIIRLNKEKVRPSSNAKSDIFLRETVAMNVMSLWKSKNILAQATGATSHGNRHSIVSNYPDMRFLIGLLVESAVFEIKPGRGSDQKEFRDLYATGSILLAGGTPIDRYKKRARGNWNTTDAVDLGDDIYDLDEEALAAMEEVAKELDNEDDDDDL